MKYLLRTLSKYKSYTIINVVGLSLGITCALILFLMIDYLTSIDRYHEKRDRTFRIVTLSKTNGRDDFNSGVPVPLIDAVANDFPELEIVAPVFNELSGRVLIGEGESRKIFEEDEGIAFCDDRLYQILDRTEINVIHFHNRIRSCFQKPGQESISVPWTSLENR